MSWRSRRQAARKRRQEILRDVRQNGWPSRTRRDLLDKASRVKAATVEHAQRVAERGRQAGRATARKVLELQQMAGLHRRVVKRSLQTTLHPDHPDFRESDRQWREGYREVAAELLPKSYLPRIRHTEGQLQEDIEAGA